MVADLADKKIWNEDKSSKNNVDKALGSERFDAETIYYRSNLHTG